MTLGAVKCFFLRILPNYYLLFSLTEQRQVLRATVIALSCIVFVLLIIIGVSMWRLRRPWPNNKIATVDNGTTDLPYQVSEPAVHMELRPTPSQWQSRDIQEYQSLQGGHVTVEHYIMGFNKDKNQNEDPGVYEEVGNT